MIEPNKELLERTKKLPVITIDDQQWPIPRLAPAQNEIVLPIILSLWPKITQMKQTNDLNETFEQLTAILGGDGMKQINDCVFLAIKRGHPTLTRKMFDEEMGVGIMEAVEALTTIAQQTGLIKLTTVVVKPGDKPVGEAEAANSQTG